LTARLSHLPCPSADDLDSALTGVLDDHVPVMRRSVRPQKNAPWFNGVAVHMQLYNSAQNLSPN